MGLCSFGRIKLLPSFSSLVVHPFTKVPFRRNVSQTGDRFMKSVCANVCPVDVLKYASSVRVAGPPSCGSVNCRRMEFRTTTDKKFPTTATIHHRLLWISVCMQTAHFSLPGGPIWSVLFCSVAPTTSNSGAFHSLLILGQQNLSLLFTIRKSIHSQPRHLPHFPTFAAPLVDKC